MSLCELVFFKISRIVFIGLLIIGNCTSNVDAQSTAKLHIGVLPIDISSLPLYAADRGFFKAEGLDVDISLMNNGPTIVAAVSSLGPPISFRLRMRARRGFRLLGSRLWVLTRVKRQLRHYWYLLIHR